MASTPDSSHLGCTWAKTQTVAAPGQVEHLRLVLGNPLHAARHHALAGLLQEVDEVLTAADIPYWLSGGTLIGALRHNNIIPHDDDIDIDCLEKDLPRISTVIRENIANAHLVRTGTWCCAEVYSICKRMAGTTLMIDICPRPESGYDGEGGGNELFTSLEEVFPLRRCEFAGISVSVPSNVSVLDRLYGPLWCSQVHVWNHSAEGNQPLSAPLLPVKEYEEIVASVGYNAPKLQSTSEASFKSMAASLALIHATRRADLEKSIVDRSDFPESEFASEDEGQLKARLSDDEHQWRQLVQLWLLHSLGKVLAEEGVLYWASGRTLLGALRYGNMVPYDGIVALECFEEDFLRILAAARKIPHVTITKGDYRGEINLYEAAAEIAVHVCARPRDVSEELPAPKAPFFSEALITPVRVSNFADIDIPCPGAVDVSMLLESIFSKEQPALEACDVVVASATSTYKAPSLMSWDTLSASGGPLERLLWARLGWASPLGPVADDSD